MELTHRGGGHEGSAWVQHCITACNAALELDESNVKAYYRRAQAYLRWTSAGATEHSMAVKDLIKANKLDPTNSTVARELHKQRALMRRQVPLLPAAIVVVGDAGCAMQLLPTLCCLFPQAVADKKTYTGLFERGTVVDPNEEVHKVRLG